MKTSCRIWLSGASVAAAFVFWCYSQIEAYCFFYPGIDTQYAPGFSEQAFSQIATGMTVRAVQQRLGTPLDVQITADGRQLWAFTLDGKCKWGDWAWLGRQVIIRDGRVIEVVKRVYYD
jgi:hypothetical protein